LIAPDFIVTNADIYTMDPLTPGVAALAVTNGRISALGTVAEMKALAGKSTRFIDAGGRMMLPGFQDTHIHLQDGGYDYSQSAPLDKVSTIAELQQALRNFAKPTRAHG
jgi:predicted amidohydrolase YtcJ